MPYPSNVLAVPFGDPVWCTPCIATSLSLALMSCASTPAAIVNQPPPVAAVASARQAPQPPPGHLSRNDVDRVLVERGPAWIFRRVRLEEVILPDGKFSGWRIAGLPEEWRAIDVQPGNVVSKVNGMPVETHDDAWEIWKNVASSSAVILTVLRDGKAREIRIPIDGTIVAETRKALERGPAGRPPPAGPPEDSITIGGSPQEPAEGDSY